MTPELIQTAINNAIARKSKLPMSMMSDPPMLGSIQIRHLLNNLGSLATHYLEHGVHKGGSFSCAVYKNELVTATAVDCFASDQFNKIDPAQPIFMVNAEKFLHTGTSHELIVSDSFEVNPDQIQMGIDLYYFDGDHSYESQCKALTHFKENMAEEFIYVVDDYMLEDVRKGTQDGIKDGGYEVLFEKELVTAAEYDNESWWRGFAVFLLRKA